MKAKERIAAALERMAPAPMEAPDFTTADAFVWHVAPDRLDPVEKVNRVDLDLLVGIDRSRNTLLENTRQFARGLPANNALLWGARGMGKSSLVKAVHAAVLDEGLAIKIVEIQREDLPSVGRLLNILRGFDIRPDVCSGHSFGELTALHAAGWIDEDALLKRCPGPRRRPQLAGMKIAVDVRPRHTQHLVHNN